MTENQRGATELPDVEVVFTTNDEVRGLVHWVPIEGTSRTACGKDGSRWPWQFTDTWERRLHLPYLCKACAREAPHEHHRGQHQVRGNVAPCCRKAVST